MSDFQDMVASDIQAVFLNTEEFGELRTIVYDGETYKDIPVVLTGRRESERSRLADDHAQGIYQAAHVIHFDRADLGGNQPEQGTRIRIGDGEGFFRTYYVAASACAMGMVRLELEVLDE